MLHATLNLVECNFPGFTKAKPDWNANIYSQKKKTMIKRNAKSAIPSPQHATLWKINCLWWKLLSNCTNQQQNDCMVVCQTWFYQEKPTSQFCSLCPVRVRPSITKFLLLPLQLPLKQMPLPVSASFELSCRPQEYLLPAIHHTHPFPYHIPNQHLPVQKRKQEQRNYSYHFMSTKQESKCTYQSRSNYSTQK